MTTPPRFTLSRKGQDTPGPSAPATRLLLWRSNRAFSLVEVTLALGVAAICLLAIFGLLPIGLNSNQASVEQTVAASLTRAIITDLRATPVITGTAQSPSYGLSIPPSTSGTSMSHTVWLNEWGNLAGTIDQDASPASSPKYRAHITLTPPPLTTPPSKSATFVRTVISWPALADRNYKGDPAHAAGTFETVTALDRN